MDEYRNLEPLKLCLLQSRVIQAKEDIARQNTIDGESFFEELESGQYDK